MKITLPAVFLGVAAGYVALSVGLTFLGKPLAREHPEILSAFSFQEGPFSWSYSFDAGTVGPFEIRADRRATIRSALACRCFWGYPQVPQEPRVKLTDVPPHALEQYFPMNGEALLSQNSEQYSLTFADGRLISVTRSHFPLAGL